MQEQEVNLGDTAEDTITGFKGTVNAITEWLNGCVRINIQPNELKDGKPIESVSFDREQVRFVAHGPHSRVVKDAPAKSTGGPQPQPTRQADPR